MMSNKKQLTKIAASLLTAAALAIPSLSLAATSASNNANSAMAMNMETQPATEFRKINKMLQPLNLTAEQQNSVKAVLDQAKTQVTSLHDQLKENKDAIKAQQFSDSYNAKTVEGLASKQGNLVQQMIVLRSSVNDKVYKILTPDQRKQLAAMRAQREEAKAAKRASKQQ